MKRIPLCELDKEQLMKLIQGYTSLSRLQTEVDVKIYLDYRFNGYSSYELAEREHMNRVTVYRRIKKVDQYLKETYEKIINHN